MKFPISLNQERYIFSEKKTGQSYALTISYKIDENLNVDKLKYALACVVEKHEMLRCRISFQEEGIYNVIEDKVDIYVEQVSAAGGSSEIQEIIEGYFFKKESYSPQDLVKFQLITLPEKHYIFTFSVHHVIADGVSLGIIIEDISKFYNNYEPAQSKGKNYEGYCNYIENNFDSESLKQKWSVLLSKSPKDTRLLQNKQVQSSLGSGNKTFEHHVDKDFHDEVKLASQDLTVTTFSFYIAIFHIALSRMNFPQETVTVFQSSGRQNLIGYEDIVGLFSNALVFFNEIDEQMSLKQYLFDANDKIKLIIDNQNYPYHYITKDTGIHPTIGFNWYPIYQELNLNNCTVKKEEIVSWQSDLDINIHCVYDNGGLIIKVQYNSESYSQASVSLLVMNFINLLKSGVKSTEGAIFELNSSGLSEYINLKNDVSKKGKVSSNRRIENSFIAMKNEFPDRLAIVSENKIFTYQELYQQSYLLQLQIEAIFKFERPVIGIISKRGHGVVISVLASLLAKCSFAIIDERYPVSRIKEYLDVLNPDMLIINSKHDFSSLWPSHWGYINHEAMSLEFAFNDKVALSDANDTAYWLFTSGTTGKPKCISTSHEPLIHFLEWQKKKFDINSADRFAMLSGLSHDPIFRDIFSPLSVGASLYIPSDDIILSVGGLAEWISHSRLSVLHVTPQLGGLISLPKNKLKAMESVRLCFLGGDRLRKVDIDILKKVFPSVLLVNAYGATETPQVMSYYVVPEDFEKELVPIGNGIDDVEIMLKSEDGRQVSLGEYGEIIICTEFLSNGYKGSLDNIFLHDPITGVKTYSTGDLGFYDESGAVIFVGRKDDQVKVRGFRIEPSDIAVHIERYEGVQQAFVLSDSTSEEVKLVAYIVSDKKNISRENINDFLVNILPEYMIPVGYIFLDEFPLYPNGKVNRALLPKLSNDHVVRKGEFVSAVTTKEKELVKVWENALGYSPIGIEDSFYDIGGDSLSAISLMIEMEKLGICEGDCRVLFQGGSIKDIIRISSGEKSTITNSENVNFITNQLVNCMRGLLVLLVVIGHWMPGLLKRLPDEAQHLVPYITPIFNLATPGFAIVFGISLGYSMFHTYKEKRGRFYRQVKMGVMLLFWGLIIKSGAAYYAEWLNDANATISFYNVLGVYLLVIISLPVWFRLIVYKERIISNTIILILIFIALDILFEYTLLEREMGGVKQLVRLYLVAKFSYFNIGGGVLLGFLVGYQIKKSQHRQKMGIHLLVGVISMLIGIYTGLYVGELHELTVPNSEIQLWKWVLYWGAINILIYFVWKIIVIKPHYRSWFSYIPNNINILGVLALPMFVFHGVILSAKQVLDAYGLNDKIGLVLVLIIFFSVTIFYMRKLYRMYY